jgi:hypothetical protein
MPPIDPIDSSKPEFRGIAKANDTIAERSARKVKAQNRQDAQFAPATLALSDYTVQALVIPTSVGEGQSNTSVYQSNLDQQTPYDMA